MGPNYVKHLWSCYDVKGQVVTLSSADYVFFNMFVAKVVGMLFVTCPFVSLDPAKLLGIEFYEGIQLWQNNWLSICAHTVAL